MFKRALLIGIDESLHMPTLQGCAADVDALPAGPALRAPVVQSRQI